MKAPNLLEVHARKLLGKPDNWVLITYESLPKDAKYHEPRTHFQLTGAVPSTVLFKSGPRKGKPNPKFHTDRATAIISEKEHREFERAWEQETGLCRNCGDTGEESAGWGPEGARYRPCTRCTRAQKAVGQ